MVFLEIVPYGYMIATTKNEFLKRLQKQWLLP